MKRLFTLAIVAMIASLTFAQAPVQKKAATKAQIEKVASNAQMQKALEAKAAMTAKAQAAQETSASALRKAAPTAKAAAAMQMKAPKTLSAIAMQNVRTIQNVPARMQKSKLPTSKAADLNIAAESMFKTRTAPAKSFAPAKAAVADGMSAYIQENVTGQFVSNGANWGTRSVLADNGILYRIGAGSEGKYILFSGIKNDTKALRDTDGFNDQTGEWTLVPAEDGGYYMVNRNQEYYTKKAGSDIPEFTTNQEEASIWNFITPDERALELASASASNPVDATFLIKGADFLNADIANAAWSKSKVGGDLSSTCTLINSTNCEQWNAGAVDINQTLTNIPNGIYRLKAYGFVRQNGATVSSVTSYEEGTETPAYLYANDQETKLKSVFDDAYTEPMDGWSTVTSETGNTYVIPNGQNTAAAAFEEGKYLTDEIEVEVTDGTLKVGVKCDGVEWLVFDNFRLTYLGAAVQENVIEATTAATTYYASDGDWYCVLKDADNNLFYFDIVTNNPAPLEIGHEYTLADMDASYSYMKVGSKNYAYSSATFTPKQGQYGTDYEATCVLASDGTAYHIYYTAPKPETIEVEATTAGVTWYGEPDMDWFVNLYNANFEFRFDIGNQSAEGLLLNHEYTLDDMIADYSWGKNKATGASITYQSVSFKATTGANGTDYQAVVVDKNGNTYNVKYTTVAPPPTTDTVELEFAVEETDLVDAASSMGLIQFVGSKEETGLEAYVGLHTTQVAGEYTMADVEAMYTAIYLDFEDQEGVTCADLTGTVTDLGNGAYKAYFEYLGTNGTLYKLTYNYGEAQGGGNDEVVVNKDAHGIITSVTGGESKTYTRSADGTVYFVQSNQLSMGAQSGSVTIIEDAANGKVYIKDPIARFANNSWAEGTKNGNQVVVNAGQPLYYSSNYDATVSLRWGVISASGSLTNADGHADNFTYTVDGDTWTLDGTAAFGNVNGDAFFMGGFWDDDDSFAAGEAETVLTYDPEYVAPSTDLVELPAGAEVEQWNMNATSVTSSSSTPIMNQAVNVAFVGNDVYAQGVFSAFPTAWIKGTKEGNTVTFKKLQYIGNYGGSYDMYFIGTDGENMTDATATLSADAKTLTFTESLLANAATDRIYYLTWLENVVISAQPAEEPVITELMGTLPYANSFDTAAEQEEAAIYDANGDGKTFTFADDNKSGSKTARYTYSSANDADDYVVFPGFTMEAGKSYKVSVDARPYGASYPERLEIVAGTVAKASELNISILEPTDLAAADYETLTAEFTPEADGVYYIALHAISDADMFYLYTDNFSVKENNMNAPEAIADLVVTPDENAGLSATIEFTAPAKTLGGADINEEVKCVVKRDGETIFDNIVVAPGTPVQLMDNTVTEPGTYVYSVTATVGELTSDAAKATVYVGEDIPDEVENLAATDLNGKVGLTWDAPADGVNGGIIIPENLRYNVYPVEMVEFFGMQFPAIDFENPYFTELTATEATVDFDTNAGDQAYTYFGVTAENSAGESQGMMGAVLTGAPYELPVVEEFPNGQLSYWWGVDYDDAVYEAEGGLGITTDGELAFNAPVAGWIELYSGKVAINGADKPQLSFQYKGDGKLTATVYGPTKSMNGVEFTPAADYQTATVDLSELASEPWVRLTLHAEYEDAGVTNVDNIIFMNAVENDLEIAVSAPKTVVAGQSAVVTATVINKGTADASDYAVKFYVNEEEVATSFEIPTLKFFESAEFEYTLETSIFAEAGDLTVKAEVVYAADAVEANNADEAVLTVVTPTATPVENVTAEATEEGVKIDWTVASVTNEEITEDFESYEVGIVADGETMGPWAAKDGDQGMAYGWSSESINWPYTGEMYAFGIMNFPEVFGSATDIEAASGVQALMFMSVTDANGAGFEADDWFISPELPGIAQTISFKACPMTANYGAETVEVMASADGESWSKVATYDIEEENTWTECTGNLPAGTKYFALHYVSNDIFALFIDDVTYTAGGAEATGFNIYVDETQVASVDAEARTYTYADALASGNHKFSVTAVYGQKESAPVSATLATAINSVAGTQAATEAYTISGIRMDAKNLKKGVYVVNGKKVVK